MPILEVKQVSKAYREYKAVDQVSFEIAEGHIFGLLGPNGAGKTSLIRMITQITRPDTGEIWFDNEKLKLDHVHKIGYMPEERGLYKKMKVGEHLIYLANLRNVPTPQAKRYIAEWFERLEIGDWWNKKVGDLSKGMQQKIQFISTVIHKPRLIILDEPFSGLDPVNAGLIREEIGRLVSEQQMSVIFSTHRMEQVEQICDDIVLINKGKKILDGSVQEIKSAFKKNTYQYEFAGEVPEIMQSHKQLIDRWSRGAVLQGINEQEAQRLLLLVLESGAIVVKFEEILPSINEVFIDLVLSQNADYE